MEDQEKNEKLLEYEKFKKKYEDEMKKKILENKAKLEEEQKQINNQLVRISNLPKAEQEKILGDMIYWNVTGLGYFLLGFFYLRRPKKILRRILFWVPSWLTYEYYILSHYFWSVKEKNSIISEKEKEIEKNQINKESYEADEIKH
jgi:hypothetical protein